MLYSGNNLTRNYVRGKSRIRAVDDICLNVDQGEHLSIVGPSGSGKSTLLHILGLLDGDFEGELLFRGKNVKSMNAKERAHLRLKEIGIVYQGFHLLTTLNVRDNVALPYWRLHNKRRAALEKADAALARLGLEHRLSHLVNGLSIGEIQRVAIARALINDPSVVLADEPTGNLDADATAEVLKIFSDIPKQGRTLIVITHDLRVKISANRVLHLNYGRIVAK